jgi:hypothetical protein
MRRRLLLSAAFRYPQLYGQRGLAESTYLQATRLAFAPFSGAPGVQPSLPSQVCSPRRAAFSRFRDAGPACRSIGCPGPDRFRRANSVALCCASQMLGRRGEIRGCGRSRLPGFAPFEGPTHLRPQAERSADPALGFVLLQGFGRVLAVACKGHLACHRDRAQCPWSRHRG